MSEKIFVSDLVEGEHIRSVFLVVEKSVRATKAGKSFLALTLCDKSGTIDSKVWDQADAIATRFEVDDFVRVEAQVDSWQSKLQLNVRDAQKVDDSQVDLADFVPTSRWQHSALLEQLQELVNRELKSPQMRRFFDELFADEPLMRRYRTAPAAKSNHHAFLGGLIEHSLSMTRIAVQLGRHYGHYYPGLINPDLLIAGCVLHDIGKCFELSYARSFDYSNEGQFIGHIVQGVEMVTAVAARVEPPLPADMILQIKHLILSHHGKKEFGSPVLPKTPEAMLLHEIDMIDSRMNMLSNIAEEQRTAADANQGWTGYQRLFQERLYLGTPDDSAWATVHTPAQADLSGPGQAVDTPAVDTRPESAARKSSASSAPRDDADAVQVAPNLDLFSD
jgi:3'-5' exoribonuclease